VKRALDQIDAVREAVRTHPHDLMLATTAADVRRAAADHKIAALMGMEGGIARRIGSDISDSPPVRSGFSGDRRVARTVEVHQRAQAIGALRREQRLVSALIHHGLVRGLYATNAAAFGTAQI
jgi:hypothetical protein